MCLLLRPTGKATHHGTGPPNPSDGARSQAAPLQTEAHTCTHREAGRLRGLYVPPDKNVTGFLASEVVVVFQDHLVSVPYYHSKLISGKEERRQGVSGGVKEGPRVHLSIWKEPVSCMKVQLGARGCLAKEADCDVVLSHPHPGLHWILGWMETFSQVDP